MKTKSLTPVAATAGILLVVCAISAASHIRGIITTPDALAQEPGFWRFYYGAAVQSVLALLSGLTVWSWLSWPVARTLRIGKVWIIALLVALICGHIFYRSSLEVGALLLSGLWLGWLVFLWLRMVPNKSLNSTTPATQAPSDAADGGAG